MDAISSESIGFNPAPPFFMHIDLNSCFASVEQQANPTLRGKPVAVAAYVTGGGCILAASREAKKLGIKTGMRVREGQMICPKLIVLPPDPNKYRFVNRKLLSLLQEYSECVEVKSIDEMIVNFRNAPAISRVLSCVSLAQHMKYIGREIKERIKNEIGEWLTVSVGIAPNRYLAKIASELHKPDGLDCITGDTVVSVLTGMPLEGLTGIKAGYGGRLRAVGIDSALGFYQAGIKQLKWAFRSIIGYHWWLRLHGWEADDREFDRKSFGHSYALYKQYPPSDPRVIQILCQLSEKTGRRLRKNGYVAGGMHVSCQYSDGSYWHHGQKLSHVLFAGDDIYRAAGSILKTAPDKPVRILAVSCFDITSSDVNQMELFCDDTRKKSLVRALDTIAERWGECSVIPGRMLSMEHTILDRIAFGGVQGLEALPFREYIERIPEV